MGATLKPRNWNPESGTKNRNPETGNRNPQIKENKFFKYAKIVLLSLSMVKSKLPSKKDLKLNLF